MAVVPMRCQVQAARIKVAWTSLRQLFSLKKRGMDFVLRPSSTIPCSIRLVVRTCFRWRQGTRRWLSRASRSSLSAVHRLGQSWAKRVITSRAAASLLLRAWGHLKWPANAPGDLADSGCATGGTRRFIGEDGPDIEGGPAPGIHLDGQLLEHLRIALRGEADRTGSLRDSLPCSLVPCSEIGLNLFANSIARLDFAHDSVSSFLPSMGAKGFCGNSFGRYFTLSHFLEIVGNHGLNGCFFQITCKLSLNQTSPGRNLPGFPIS